MRFNNREPTMKELGFYHTPAWRKVRLLALQRDHYLCQECGRQGKTTVATEVHHVLSLESRPDLALTLTNLESLCWSCHEETKHKQHKMDKFPDSVRIIKM